MDGVFNYSQSLNDNKGVKSVYYGVVTDNIDITESKLLKARIQGLDDSLVDDDLPTAFPLLPKNFSILPKIGEMVLIFIPDTNDVNADRFYIGSIIPQSNRMDYTDVLFARSALHSGKVPLNVGSRQIPESVGVYGKGNDVIIEGRNNADIKFDKGEIILRVGKHTDQKIQNVPILNTKNQTYIQMRHNVSLFKSNNVFSMTNIVSDKINLLTHENGSPRFNLNGGDSPIDDEALLNILENAHPLPFGDVLLNYLMLMREVLLNHVHSYNGLKATNLNGEDSIKKFLEFDIKSIISKNIKIN